MVQGNHRACLLLGSNIRPELNLARAVAQLRRQLAVLQASSVWQSKAVGSGGPDFLNVALLVATPLEAGALKEQVLRPLEAEMGRVRTSDKNAPRTIDADIVLFDGVLLDEALWEYAYCAVPVAELLPDYRSGSGEALKDIALRLAQMTAISTRSGSSGFPDLFGATETSHQTSQATQ